MSDDPVEAAWATMRKVLIERYGIGGASTWLETAGAFMRSEGTKLTERHVASAENVVGFKRK